MLIVSVTRLRLRSNWFLPGFMFHALRSARQSRHAEGCFDVAVRKAGAAFWTMTLWRDVDAMRAFMLAGPHRTAMPHLVNWCDEAAVARMEWAGEHLPSWEEAERHMAAHGKLSPVKHPSPAQVAGKPMGERSLPASITASASV